MANKSGNSLLKDSVHPAIFVVAGLWLTPIWYNTKIETIQTLAEMASLPPVPPPPRPPIDLAKVSRSILLILVLGGGSILIAKAILGSINSSIFESRKQASITKLRQLLGNGKFYECFEESQSLPSNLRDETWSIRSECIQAEMRRIEDKKQTFRLDEMQQAWSNVNSIIKSSYSDHLNLGQAQGLRTSLATSIEESAKKYFDNGDVDSAAKLLELIGKSDSSAELKALWISDKENFSRASTIQPNATTGADSSNIQWPEMKTAYWSKQLAELKTKFDEGAFKIRDLYYQSLYSDAQKLSNEENFRACIDTILIAHQRRYGPINEELFGRVDRLFQYCGKKDMEKQEETQNGSSSN